MKAPLVVSTTILGLLGRGATAVDLTLTDTNSIKNAASTIAYGLLKYYTGNNTGDVPGNLPQPYYWWEAGAMFGTLIDYWLLTKDTTYNTVTMQAMLHQAGDDADFMPKNQTLTEGNDDQGFWAMAAMSAAENVFPNPPTDQPQWLPLVQAVFNQYVNRWDPADCGGGLRWQIFSFNKGYNYKNSIANGCFFNIAARLARYTGNTTYADWATKVFQWEQKVGLITGTYQVLDGVTIADDHTCTSIDSTQWSYNAAIYMHGVATMYNITSDPTWKTALDGIIKEALSQFVQNGIVYEQFCEPRGFCDVDQTSFKGYFMRWLAGTTQMAPYTSSTLMPIIQNSAAAAAAICTGPASATFKGIAGTGCGFAWVPQGKYDGNNGVGPQMDALSAVMYTLTPGAPIPATAKTGGTSKSDPSAGKTDSDKQQELEEKTRPTPAGRVGAAVITAIFAGSVLGGCAVLLM